MDGSTRIRSGVGPHQFEELTATVAISFKNPLTNFFFMYFGAMLSTLGKQDLERS